MVRSGGGVSPVNSPRAVRFEGRRHLIKPVGDCGMQRSGAGFVSGVGIGASIQQQIDHFEAAHGSGII